MGLVCTRYTQHWPSTYPTPTPTHTQHKAHMLWWALCSLCVGLLLGMCTVSIGNVHVYVYGELWWFD